MGMHIGANMFQPRHLLTAFRRTAKRPLPAFAAVDTAPGHAAPRKRHRQDAGQAGFLPRFKLGDALLTIFSRVLSVPLTKSISAFS